MFGKTLTPSGSWDERGLMVPDCKWSLSKIFWAGALSRWGALQDWPHGMG